jgi:hypothetical protein
MEGFGHRRLPVDIGEIQFDADGCFVVSKTRFDKDYVRLTGELEIAGWLQRGYHLLMSNQAVEGHRAPSLIAPASIVFYKRADSATSAPASAALCSAYLCSRVRSVHRGQLNMRCIR